jgi:hypothetical protein
MDASRSASFYQGVYLFILSFYPEVQRGYGRGNGYFGIVGKQGREFFHHLRGCN